MIGDTEKDKLLRTKISDISLRLCSKVNNLIESELILIVFPKELMKF